MMDDVMSPDWRDALCPECSRPATGTSGAGNWVFFCSSCAIEGEPRRWGHPQERYPDGPAAVLYDCQKMYARYAR
jgi:hypothetical protein